MNILEYNSAAWDKLAENGIEWSIPATTETIEKARKGDWEVILTPLKTVPREWFGDVKGKDILCLASGGGQQAPVLAAAGANVTAFDNSVVQLEKDKFVAERDNLQIILEKGDAGDLSRFDDASFDLIFHPCSNCFMANLRPIWRECFRVLRRTGALLAGFNQPFVYIFDRQSEEQDRVLKVRHRLPYSDLESLTEPEKAEMIAKNEPFEFSHTLDEQIGEQIAAGFLIAGFYEDYWTDEARLLNKFAPTFISTKAIKP
ncbi:MAG: class I SAM-dependent methyltransferase [Acidobacteria bacterium]|nr:class I SAM-dependent methyltransferase [Acidobacteriota bacterium]MCA1639235.1 class I SAM-dependent methyltransferase [Acidobacteriota bacterium]